MVTMQRKEPSEYFKLLLLLSHILENERLDLGCVEQSSIEELLPLFHQKIYQRTMGQCQSDNNSLSGGSSLPPTLSLPSSRSLEAEYPPPKLLSPRQRKFVQQEVITTLSPPQSPAATVATRSKQKIKEAERVTTKSRNFVEVSSNIDIVDIKPKMTTPLCATKPDAHDSLTPHASSSPPIPFHKQQLATPRLNIANDDKKKLEERYEGVLRMFFVCYIAAVAFFFFIMCRSLFHQHANTHGVAPDVPAVAAIDTNTETRNGQLEFLQAIGHFNLQEDLKHLLPLNAVKEMLSDNKHILDTIDQELGEILDTVLI